MPMKIQLKIENISLKWLKPVRLCLFDQNTSKTDKSALKELKVNGIYFLSDQWVKTSQCEPFGTNTIYIGKACGKYEQIHGRCQKHYRSLMDIRNPRGEPRERPGKGLKKCRERIWVDRGRRSVEEIFIYPGIIFSNKTKCSFLYRPYLISLVEGFLLDEFFSLNGRFPEGNLKV